MSDSIKKYINYYVYIGFTLIFLVLVLIATSGSAPYDSTAIELGTLHIQWYAIFILFGLSFGGILAYIEFKKKGVDTDILWDGLLIMVPLAIFGARIWYVLFNLDKYNGDIGRMLDLTEGGLGIHGAFLMTMIAIIPFCRWKKINHWFILDVVAPGFLIGQTLGRWGNFMNRELYGPALENANWLPPFIKDQMFINGAYRHPTFLYESVWNLIGLIIILILREKKAFKLGDIIAMYLVWYGIGRIPTEFLRLQSGVSEPLMLFGVPVSIATSIGLLLGGVAIFIYNRFFKKDEGYYKDYGKKAVLFDLDGTLLDTIELIFDNIKKTFAKHLPKITLTEEQLKQFVGPTLQHSFAWYEPDPEKVELMVETYRKINLENHDKGVLPYPHAKETLKALKEHGYVIGIVSSKLRNVVEIGLRQNDMLQYVDVVIGSDDVVKHKPDKEPLVKAMNALNVSPLNSVYIGDHNWDIEAAKAAGMTSIGVSYSIHYDKLVAANPDYIIDDLAKLLFIL